MLKDYGLKFDVVEGVGSTVVGSNTTTAGAIINCQDYLAVMPIMRVSSYTDGTFTPLVSVSDDSGMSGEREATDDELGALTEAEAALSGAGTSQLAYTGNLQYMTTDIVSTGVTTGATVRVDYLVIKKIASNVS